MGMNEADTRSKLIDPAMWAVGWTQDNVKREESAGTIIIAGKKARRASSGRMDYTLRLLVNKHSQPVAVAFVEAKAEHLPANHGLEQVKLYTRCSLLNVPFAFSSNGHQFVEYDAFTGKTSGPRPMSEFPSPDELRARYEKGKGFSLDDDAARPLLTPYAGGEATRRYYQDAAIRAVLEKVALSSKAGDSKRALLSLATGSGKTFIAVNLLRRIADAGQLKRALFVCDRDELREQGLGALQQAFGSEAAIATASKPNKNARIVVATYQTLGVATDDAEATFLTDNYPEDYFSHIVIDECHRSAWGRWSQVLTRNPNAVQVGLTATPRQLKLPAPSQVLDRAEGEAPTGGSASSEEDARILADNIKYFGEPVYEYGIGQGIEDGYLAACEIVKARVNLDEAGLSIDEVMARNPVDAITGAPLSRDQVREMYGKTDYENRILLPDRLNVMCADLFDHLLTTGGPHQKTIVFCARDGHAQSVADAMNNLYADWCEFHGEDRAEPFAFKCTAASGGGGMLPDFKGSSSHHFVATTVDLLTTGVDVPAVRNVVFFKYVKSPISFYQMVGRGTRLDTPTGKLMFRVYDYTNATRLFGEEFLSRPASVRRTEGQPTPAPSGNEGEAEGGEKVVRVEGFEVLVTDEGRFVVTQVEGKAMPITVEEYRQKVARELVQAAPDAQSFRARWVAPGNRRELLARLPDGGAAATVLRFVSDMEEFDLFDVLGEIGYGLAPLTRTQRAEQFALKHADWLAGLPDAAARTLRALADQFARSGTEELENPAVWKVPAVTRAGGFKALAALGAPGDALRQAKERLFSP